VWIVRKVLHHVGRTERSCRTGLRAADEYDMMTRGAFSNVQLKNQMVPRAESGIMPYVLNELTSDEPAHAA